MAQPDIPGFKTAADETAYEADYAERAKDHQEEEARYINNNQDARLFENVQYHVFIAGFKHSVISEGVSIRGKGITEAAIAGYCGQQYTTELMEWFQEEWVDMITRAFRAVEVCRQRPFSYHTSTPKGTHGDLEIRANTCVEIKVPPKHHQHDLSEAQTDVEGSE
jgi:hypothetical protein